MSEGIRGRRKIERKVRSAASEQVCGVTGLNAFALFRIRERAWIKGAAMRWRLATGEPSRADTLNK